MFIRLASKTVKDKKYTQFQLMESIRTPMGPRQKLIFNLGSIELEPNERKELANAIEGELNKQGTLIATNPKIQKLAEHFAALILQDRLNKKAVMKDNYEQEISCYKNVDLNSLEHSNAKGIGTEHVMLSQMKEFRIDEILRDLNFTEQQVHYAKMLIAGRGTHPSSELETSRWVEENSGIKELMGADMKVYDNGLHRTAKLLWNNKAKLESRLSQKTKDLFSLDENIILYDLTNTFFEGRKENSGIAKHGRSKERRNDRPLVTLALTVDEEGFPKQSQIYKGNISEPKTLKNILNKLEEKNNTDEGEKTIVIDAGIATKENLEEIRNRNFHYVAVSRDRTYPQDFWKNSEEKTFIMSDKKTILKTKTHRTDKEIFLLCHSSAKAEKENSILQRKLKKFEEELTQINEGLKKKRTRKTYKHIVEKIGRLKERYYVGNLYDITISKKDGEDEKDQIVTQVTFIKNPKGKSKELDVGKYVIRTDRLDLSEEQISQIHRSLTRIEDSFRNMKSNLGLRPNFHKSDVHTKAHIFITVLAYFVIASVLKKLYEKDIHYSWNSVRNILSSHTRVTSTFKTQEKEIIHMRGNTRPNTKQSDIYRALSIKQNPLGNKMITVPVFKKTES